MLYLCELRPEDAVKEPAVSVEPSALLEAAQSIVAEQLSQLRTIAESAQQRQASIKIELRQIERALDEAVLQSRFAAEHGLPTAAEFAAREQTLRASYDKLVQEAQKLQHAIRQLDQLTRQIDMSSATLRGGGEGEPADPWVQALRSQVITGREEERARLAREVHDGPAQVLANTLMGLEQSRSLLREQRIDHLALLLDRLSGATREGLHEIRQFIANLRPGQLAEQGLTAALQDYIRRYRDTRNPSISFETDTLPRLAPEVEIVLYRTVQEALQNAHKHARGAAVHVTLAVRQQQLSLTIRDEGPGFNPRDVARRAGRESWGLTSMRERADLIGARFVVTSRPGHGTEVAVTLPLR
jgi:two-component system sensor histidine kinase DegS